MDISLMTTIAAAQTVQQNTHNVNAQNAWARMSDADSRVFRDALVNAAPPPSPQPPAPTLAEILSNVS